MSMEKEDFKKTYTFDEILDKFNEELEARPWYQKVWDYIVYVIFGRMKDSFREVRNYFINLHRFRHQLMTYQPWDMGYMMSMFNFCLKNLADYIDEKGYEVDELRVKKVAAMRELHSLIEDLVTRDTINDLAIEELRPGFLSSGYTSKEYFMMLAEIGMSKLSKTRNKIRDKKLKRVFELVKGQNYDEWEKLNKGKGPKDKDYVRFEDWFDGSGLTGWWD